MHYVANRGTAKLQDEAVAAYNFHLMLRKERGIVKCRVFLCTFLPKKLYNQVKKGNK